MEISVSLAYDSPGALGGLLRNTRICSSGATKRFKLIWRARRECRREYRPAKAG